jgi:prepilin-type N-terminal cleavage/methylation domain-containing protein
MSKKNKKLKKGFTLIELMVVIAILGILATMVVISLQSARRRANESSIMVSAVSMMKAAQAESVESSDFTAWGGIELSWPHSDTAFIATDPAACDSFFNNVADPVSARKACKNILERSEGGMLYVMGIGNAPAAGGGLHPRLSIMAWLPVKQKFFCTGSNGRSSATQNEDGSGCGGFFDCPGCLLDPLGDTQPREDD